MSSFSESFGSYDILVDIKSVLFCLVIQDICYNNWVALACSHFLCLALNDHYSLVGSPCLLWLWMALEISNEVVTNLISVLFPCSFGSYDLLTDIKSYWWIFYLFCLDKSLDIRVLYYLLLRIFAILTGWLWHALICSGWLLINIPDSGGLTLPLMTLNDYGDVIWNNGKPD